MEYEIGHVNDIFMNFTVPTEIWLKDGMIVTQPRINMQMFNGRLTTMHSFTVTSTDAGLYQVVFTDTARSEIFVALPTRIDTGELNNNCMCEREYHTSNIYTGETLTVEPVSSLVTALRLPETLVLEVRTTGRFFSQQWSRNGSTLVAPQQFVDFGDVYISTSTTTADLGTYELSLITASGSCQTSPATIIFKVIEPGRKLTLSFPLS